MNEFRQMKPHKLTSELTSPIEWSRIIPRNPESRRKSLSEHLLSLKERDSPGYRFHVEALEKAIPELSKNPPAWVGISGDGQIFCSELEVEVVAMQRANSPFPWLRIELR